jgi:hypothetical protein
MPQEKNSKLPQISPGTTRAAAYIASAGSNARKASPAIPLGAMMTGDALFDPKHDAVTVSQVEAKRLEVQSPQAEGKAPNSGLSQQTLDGLSAVKAAAQAAITKEVEEKKEAAAADVLDPQRGERQAVKDRCKPMDLLDGIVDDCYTQVVPIVPDKLVVRFVSIRPDDHHAIQALLTRWIDEDKNLDIIWREVLGCMQTAAMVDEINGKKMPPFHTIADNGWKVFDEGLFTIRYKMISQRPAPMVQSLGRHAEWFDERCRELFTFDSVKKS